MNIDTVRKILNNKLKSLQLRREHHFTEGDIDIVASLDIEIFDIQTTLNLLNSKPQGNSENENE